MKLTFLGSGSFFAGTDNFHSNLLLEADSGKKLLIDCGSDFRHSIVAAGYSVKDIDAVYVSHLHDDHAGGLEYLGYGTFFTPDQPRPHLFVHQSLVGPIWYNKLAVGMATQHQKQCKLSTYFQVHGVKSHFEWEGIKFSLVPAVHVVNQKSGHMYTYGLDFKLNGVRIYFTSDIAINDEEIDDKEWDVASHMKHYRHADIIFHDCETINSSPVHTHYNVLKTLPSYLKNKMWLYHTQASNQPKATDDGFLGIVKKGQVFSF